MRVMGRNQSVGIGVTQTTNQATKLQVGGSVTAVSAIAQGAFINTTLVAAANNDVLVGLDINPTFTNGAFTGVANVDLRTKNAGVVVGSGYGFGATYGYTNDGIVQIKDVGSSGNLTGNYTTQIVLRQAGNSGGLNGNYWGFIETNTSGTMLASGRYTSLYLRAGGSGGATGNIYFQNSATNTAMMIANTSANLLVGTTTDAGFRLDVNGTARVNATGNVLTIQNSTNARNFTFNPSYATLTYGGSIAHSSGFITFTSDIGTDNSSAIGIVLGAPAGNRVASALFEMISTNRGFLPPRLTTTQKNAISSPATGLVVFDTTLGKLCVFSTTWQTITSL
jgi:hypothetical protein